MESEDIKNIKHPDFILIAQEADQFTSKICFGNINIFYRLKNKIKETISKLLKFMGLYKFVKK
jgi:hypothetical protein